MYRLFLLIPYTRFALQSAQRAFMFSCFVSFLAFFYGMGVFAYSFIEQAAAERDLLILASILSAYYVVLRSASFCFVVGGCLLASNGYQCRGAIPDAGRSSCTTDNGLALSIEFDKSLGPVFRSVNQSTGRFAQAMLDNQNSIGEDYHANGKLASDSHQMSPHRVVLEGRFGMSYVADRGGIIGAEDFLKESLNSSHSQICRLPGKTNELCCTFPATTGGMCQLDPTRTLYILPDSSCSSHWSTLLALEDDTIPFSATLTTCMTRWDRLDGSVLYRAAYNFSLDADLALQFSVDC